jgi:hypothetical protein
VSESQNATRAPQRRDGTPPDIEAMRPALRERFGADFVKLVEDMGLPLAHLRDLLDATPEQQQLAMAAAWMRAAAKLEGEWSAHTRRAGPEGYMSLARYLEIRQPSPAAALKAELEPPDPPSQPAAAPEPPPPTQAERISAQRRIRIERAIAEARAALQRIDALDQLVPADRQAIVAELEDVISLISRRLRIGG